MKKLLLLVVFGCATAVVPAISASAKDKSAANDSVEGQAGGTVVVPEGLKASDVQHSILEAASGRGWTVVSKDDNKVVIHLAQGRWVSELSLVYNPSEVQIFSRSTRNGKPGLPEDWIKYLKQDLVKSMNTKAFLK
jgi:hypothetical protein